MLSTHARQGLDDDDPRRPTAERHMYGGRYATVGYYPAVGNRLDSSGAPVNVAASGFFWLSARPAIDTRSASLLWVAPTGFAASTPAIRANGLSVRCVQEE